MDFLYRIPFKKLGLTTLLLFVLAALAAFLSIRTSRHGGLIIVSSQNLKREIVVPEISKPKAVPIHLSSEQTKLTPTSPSP